MDEEIVAWWQWCRLCAKEDNENNINVVSDTALTTAIGKYFWVNIKSTDVSQHICRDCLRLITLLVSFTERVNKVQAMLYMLQNAKTKQTGSFRIDPYDLRSQYDLLEEDFQHIAKEKDLKQNLLYSEETSSENSHVDQEDHSVEDQDHEELHTHSEIGEEAITQEELQQQDNIRYSENQEDDTVEYYEDSPKRDHLDSEVIFKNEKELNDLENEEQDYLKRAESDRSLRNSYSKKPKIELPIAHQQELESFVQPRYTCSVCGKNYKNATSFRKHMMETHNTEPDIPDFVCHKCNRVLPTVRQLIVHSRSHLPLEEKLIVPCPYCDKKFTNESVTKQHINSVHFNQKKFMCEECGMVLKTHQSFNDHKLIHSSDYPYECEVCNKKFKHKTRLKTHMDTHAETVYVCTICGVRLNTKRTLKMHMLVHSEERAYKCNFCNAEFKRGKALKNHLILHIGLRPYKCNFCEKTFTNGSNCRSHKKRFHPAELAEEEAAGLKNEPTSVPKMSELRARSDIKRPTAISRNSGGLPSRVRALLIASERRKELTKKKNSHKATGSKAVSQTDKYNIEDHSSEANFMGEEMDEKEGGIQRFEECEETVVYELKQNV